MPRSRDVAKKILYLRVFVRSLVHYNLYCMPISNQKLQPFKKYFGWCGNSTHILLHWAMLLLLLRADWSQSRKQPQRHWILQCRWLPWASTNVYSKALMLYYFYLPFYFNLQKENVLKNSTSCNVITLCVETNTY